LTAVMLIVAIQVFHMICRRIIKKGWQHFYVSHHTQLLEYNVEKRLKPRLERLRIAKENQAKEVGSAAAVGVSR